MSISIYSLTSLKTAVCADPPPGPAQSHGASRLCDLAVDLLQRLVREFGSRAVFLEALRKRMDTDLDVDIDIDI